MTLPQIVFRTPTRTQWAKGFRSLMVALVLLTLMGVQESTLGADVQPLVSVGKDGKLVYTPDSRGNRIPDFSKSGYMGGGVALPDRIIREQLEPVEGDSDDTARIQAAIDRLSSRKSDGNGLRGVLLLKRGLYRVSGTLFLKASGVVIRGEGQENSGTILLGTGTRKRSLIVVGGRARTTEVAGTRRKIADNYVPWGTDSFSLHSTEGLSMGDSVIVFRPGTKDWIHDIKMDQIPPREGRRTVQWQAESYDLRFERTIAAIEGNQITLDASVVNSMEAEYGGGYVYRFQEKGRITQVGVEHLRLVSEYRNGQENQDEAHAWVGVSLHGMTNGWVRNITTVHLSHAVSVGRMAKFVTVQDCACVEPVSIITGGRRYPYTINGQYCLVQRCYSDHSRHAAATGSRVCGPNVFLDCLAEHTHTDTGPHHRWAVGILWDNLKGGDFNAQDRAWMGTGHGWAGAQQVFWNCETSSICVQQPPTAQNYAIGCLGKINRGSFSGREPGYYESHGLHVEPRSLYLQQLQQRLGLEAVKNVTTAAQRLGTIYQELKQQHSQ